MTITSKYSAFWLLTCCLGCTGLMACSTPSPRVAVAGVPALPVANYSGLFISGCTTLDEGIYYADAIDLKPENGVKLKVQYTKVFFASASCELEGQVLQLRLPVATWDITGQASANGKMPAKVQINLAAGNLTGQILNPSKVTETATEFELTYGVKNEKLPILKATEALVEKELLLVEGDKLFLGDSSLPVEADGYPTGLKLDVFFLRR